MENQTSYTRAAYNNLEFGGNPVGRGGFIVQVTPTVSSLAANTIASLARTYYAKLSKTAGAVR